MGNAGRAIEAGVPHSRLSPVSPWLYECGEWHRGIWIRLDTESRKR